jgi:uncharacterized protein
MQYTNRLIKETSPYLRQHAHNPVDWYPWGDEALQKAKQEDKPILVSIGYAACHWCHVMERESFEDEATAAFMNEHFVNIKIDREERPDLDHIYMDAVQAMSGSGGWPLNVFLTPERKPFYGGTYYPPVPAFNRASWKQILAGVSEAFHERRHEIDAQAENLTSHIEQSSSFGMSDNEESFTAADADIAFSNLMRSADTQDGGFGNAPKFPQTFSIRYLLHHHYYTQNTQALHHACLSLDKMIYGGIYDQLGGGFARYSTDKEWLAPHFEKMLYDNGLLVSVLSEAYQATGRQLYFDTIAQTLDFIEREFLSPEGGFYSALDADSEGEEGKYYVWSHAEVKELLGTDAELFCEFYDISPAGNWEHKSIMRVLTPLEEFVVKKNILLNDFIELLTRCRNRLFEARSKRPRPLLDDKIILGWNALMNTGYSRAYAATGNEKYKTIAVSNQKFLDKAFATKDENILFHTYKEVAKYPAFLDDYAYYIESLILLQEITADAAYLERAKHLTRSVIDHFSDNDSIYFYFTEKDQKDVIVRKKEVYDGAVPSGNSVMAWNLYYLGIVYDIRDWTKRALKMFGGFRNVAIKYPTSFGVWAAGMQGIAYGIPEIVITGKQPKLQQRDFLRTFIPFRVYQSFTRESNDFPLGAGKSVSDRPLIFLCKDYSCQSPVTEIDELRKLLVNV